jgi:hemolysin activation/secretion protein
VNASTSGQGNAGQITINTDGAVSLDGVNGLPTALLSNVEEGASGNSGGVNIVADSLSLSNGALVESRTRGNGNAADINLQARNKITFTGMKDGWNSGVYSTVEEGAKGQGGNVHINTGVLLLKYGGSITTYTNDIGNGGTVTINSGSLSLADRGSITTSTYGTGDAGNVTINADDTVDLTEGFIFSTVEAGGVGDGGTVTINSGSLSLADGGQIQTLVRGIDGAEAGGNGNAGNVIINADEAVTISGNSSAIFSELGARTEGNAGNIEIQVTEGSLNLNDGARVNASTSGQGNAGNLTVTSDRLTLQNQGQLTVSGQGNSNPGNLTITADNITLDNQSIIEANTESGTQGNITLNTKNLLTLRRGSEISTDATGTATGGNITINADDGFIIAVPEENSDITANATQAEGGQVFVNATNLYGIKPREQPTPKSDITASSSLGSEFSGIVEINTPDVDRNGDLVQLPDRPTETEIVQACSRGDTKKQSEFVVKGSGGLPPSPEDALDSDAVKVDWVTRPPQNKNSPKITNPISDKSAPIVEAQGWMVNDNNEIVLVADNSNNTWQNSPQCQKKAALTQTLNDATPQLGYNSNQNILIASTKTTSSLAKVPERINVNRFEVIGNKVFESQELTEVLAPFTDKPLSFSELLQARSAITKYYTKRGYITSGAYIPRQRLQDKVVKIQIVEGYLEGIEITGNKRLNSNYFSRRIETASDSVQQEKLLAALQLLQQDPLITSISAELEAGTHPGASVLAVEVKEADSFKTPISFDNRRTPSVGSLRRQLAINEGNLLGFGDNLFLAYSNTEGSDAFDGSYAVPFNAHNGTLTVSGGLSSSKVVEEPFNQLNILGDSHYYELSLRQPLIQTPTQEFALGITASRRDSNISSLLEEFDVPPSELSPGADESGQTRVSALRFFQEWTSHNSREVIAARSQFNLGLNAFDATVNEDAPDSRFLAWQGQAQWLRQLAPNTSFLLRGGIQLATTSLLSSEQFGLGGLETLRGYRQDLLLTDNAAFASAEIRLPIFRIDQIDSVFQLAPFFDVGTAWNNGEQRDGAETNTLASIGLGLRLLFNGFTARLDWGIPLISVNSEKKTWQENGLYFSLEYSPF